MINVIIVIIGLVLGFVVGIIIAAYGIARYMIGSLKMIYVGDNLERVQMEFNTPECRDRVDKLNYVFLSVRKVMIEDPDGDLTQEIQSV